MESDPKKISDAQRKDLCGMMGQAFIEIRFLCRGGKCEQAADLADAFHNLPGGIWSDDFSLEFFYDVYLGEYQRKYPDGRRY